MSQSSNVKTVDCTKTCKMTTEMRNSKYCNGRAKVVGSKVFYGCQENIEPEPIEIRQFYSCDLWELGLEDSCYSCILKCKNNKNKNFEKILGQKKQLEKIVDDLRPNMLLCGVTAGQVEKISNQYTKKNSDGKVDPLGTSAVQSATFANGALKMVLEGKRVDLAFYTLYARRMSARVKRYNKNRKKKKA